MGADFIEKATRTFKKTWDKGRVALATADLFTRQPSRAARTAAADILEGANLHIGDRLIVEVSGGQLVAKSGLTEVARFTNPPAELVSAVEASCGIAKGIVEQVHDLARVAEISLC